MSFRCDHCNNPIEGSPINRVIERREKKYTNEKGKESYGHEIVKEQKLCSNCEKEVIEAPVPYNAFAVIDLDSSCGD